MISRYNASVSQYSIMQHHIILIVAIRGTRLTCMRDISLLIYSYLLDVSVAIPIVLLLQYYIILLTTHKRHNIINEGNKTE